MPYQAAQMGQWTRIPRCSLLRHGVAQVTRYNMNRAWNLFRKAEDGVSQSRQMREHPLFLGSSPMMQSRESVLHEMA